MLELFMAHVKTSTYLDDSDFTSIQTQPSTELVSKSSPSNSGGSFRSARCVLEESDAYWSYGFYMQT